ncbi:MAG TPA: FAD/NAD(P)-binding protein [Allosphingosinicella sp.]|nr:FAD/NAD(P)-binding protein [Allosphingosinicella sp.]
MTQRHVAVIGGGYSGTMQAIALLRQGARVTLIERGEQVGRGVAYSTRHADHLLNVRASGMSAFADEPAHFTEWLAARGGGAGDFAERRLYGTYVQELLATAAVRAGDRLQIVRGEAADVVRGGDGENVRLTDGGSLAADAVILSIGNLAPDIPRTIASDLRQSAIYVADPWAADIAAGLADEDQVLLIGTGLTAIDAALMLDSAGFRGRILALSRRGLVPRAHIDPPSAAAGLHEMPRAECASLVRRVRKDAEKIGWRAAVDQLRPVTQALWNEAGVEQRRRFLRHLGPYWDVHRHRIAPSIAARIRGMAEEGRLSFAAGKILSTSLEEKLGQVSWRPRGSVENANLIVARIVNCTGPQADISRAGEPLLDRLLAAGRIRPDPCRIGIDVDTSSRTIGASGEASSSLYAIGPMTRGTFWEIVAVPDIRGQVQAVAARLAQTSGDQP